MTSTGFLMISTLQADIAGFLTFFGRFHPLVVHLPIGFLLAAIALEVFSSTKRFAQLQHAVSFLLALAAFSAVITALLGYWLSISGDYDQDSVFWHKWLGIGLAVFCVIAWWCRRQYEKQHSAPWKKSYFGILAISFVLLVAAGHAGGSLTHGSDYITSAMPNPLRKIVGLPPSADQEIVEIENIQEAVVFHDIIQPILHQRCVSCHNATKKKGELQLDSEELILKGGKHGQEFIPGNPGKSRMYTNLLLPLDDDKHMPPKGKTPLTQDQISMICWWISQGAPFDKKVADLTVPDSIQQALAKIGKPRRKLEGIFAKAVEPVDPTKLSAILAGGFMVMPVANEVNYVMVYLAQEKDTLHEKDVELLKDVSKQMTWLDLSRKHIEPDAMAALGQFGNLTKLHLEKTNLNDNMLKDLTHLKNLEYLNLYGTDVTDDGMQHLDSLQNLKALYLWQTKVTESGIDRLKAKNPNLLINDGLQANNSADSLIAKNK